MKVWILTSSKDGGPDYSIDGVYTARSTALAEAGGEIHPGAGRLESHGGIGWRLPDGRDAWREDADGSLTTYGAMITEYEVLK